MNVLDIDGDWAVIALQAGDGRTGAGGRGGYNIEGQVDTLRQF